MFEPPWPPRSHLGGRSEGTDLEPFAGNCPECGESLVLCEAEARGSLIRIWGERRQALWGMSRRMFTRLAGGEADGPPPGTIDSLTGRWAGPAVIRHAGRACPGCGLVLLRVRSPERLRPRQPGELLPSRPPTGSGTEAVPGEPDQ